MFHHHPVRGRCARWLALAWAVWLGACSGESPSAMDTVLRQLLVEQIGSRKPPYAYAERVHCLGILDTARNPTGPRPLIKRNETGEDPEFSYLCSRLMKQGRVKDPDPGLLTSLRREWFLEPTDIRPISECMNETRLSGEALDRAYLLFIERMEYHKPDQIGITFQIRALCGTEPGFCQGRQECFFERQEERWLLTGCGQDTIT